MQRSHFPRPFVPRRRIHIAARTFRTGCRTDDPRHTVNTVRLQYPIAVKTSERDTYFDLFENAAPTGLLCLFAFRSRDGGRSGVRKGRRRRGGGREARSSEDCEGGSGRHLGSGGGCRRSYVSALELKRSPTSMTIRSKELRVLSDKGCHVGRISRATGSRVECTRWEAEQAVRSRMTK
jgi:hypothetical protein